MKKFSIKIINLNNKKINIISKKFKIIYINLIDTAVYIIHLQTVKFAAA